MLRRFVSARGGAALAAAAALAFGPAAQAQHYSVGGRSFGGYGGGHYGGYGSGYGGYGVNRFPGSYGGYYPGYHYGGYNSGYGYRYPGSYGSYYQAPGIGYGSLGNYSTYQQYAVPQYGYTQQYAVPQYGYTQQYVAPQYGSQQYAVPQAGYAQQDTAVPATGTTQSLYTPSGTATRLTVRLPAEAQLWVDNFQPTLTGTVRVLMTPPLQPGQTYHYTVKAQWDDNGRPVLQERVVNFQAGGDVTVDFTQPEPPAAPSTTPAPTVPPVNPPAAPVAPPV